MRDAGAAHPVDWWIFVQLLPDDCNFARISTEFLADEQRPVALYDAVGNEPVRGQVRVCAGETVAGEARVRMNGHAGRAPMRERVRAVGDSAARDGRVQDE